MKAGACLEACNICFDACGIVLSFADRESEIFPDLVAVSAKACGVCVKACCECANAWNEFLTMQ